MNKHLQPLTPAALYARVSSDRQDVDLSVSAQLRALKDFAKANGYSVAREYVDEAESGRVADRPQFKEMIEEGSKPKAPFEVILVWKFSRFTRKREHAVVFKAMLLRKGIRVVSITEHADDSPTGKLMEAIIESVDEFYSENLAQEVTRGMREAASRGFFLGSKAPYGYKRVKVSDGVKERPTLEVDPATAPVVKEIFESSLSGNGLKEISKTLNDRGITNRGKRWYKGGLHYLLSNEAYTGTAVWGRTSKGEKAQEPVRVEGAWPALISRELFDGVQQAMRGRAPKVQKPARVGSRFLLSGLLKCGVCGRPYSGQGAKSGQFAYYICGTLFREGAGTCSARYLNAPRVEDFVVEKIRERILTEETIVELVTMVAEEIDAMAGELAGRLDVIDAELGDVRKRLERLYEALESSELTLEVLSPRIFSLRHREEQLEAAREEAETKLEQRRVELPTTEEIKGYVADFREFLREGTFPERKALIRNFVEGIEVVGDEATLTYTIPMPNDGVIRESASVLDFVQSGLTPTPVPASTPAPTPRPTPPPDISGQGTDVRFVDLPAGEWIVEMSVSDNGSSLDFISIKIGDGYVASVRAGTWSGRSLIAVGNESSEIPPGKAAVEINVSQDASWALKFIDPPPTLDADETISGQGQDVKFVDLSDGEWVVEISISGNSRCYAVLDSCSEAFFTIGIGGDDVVFEGADTWSGKKLVAVGSAYDEIPPGRTPIEVEAESSATWTLKFTRATVLSSLTSDETISGQGTDVRFVDLPAGEWIVEMSVSDNGSSLDFISIKIGDGYVASVRAGTWSGRSLIAVGNESSEIPPGKAAVEINVSQDASWALKFIDPPPTLDADETISGQGQDVKFVDLSDGEWVVEISISGNSRCYAVLDSCSEAFFTIGIGGDDVVFEGADTWSGKKLVAVGSAYDEIPPGRTAIEVEAESGAMWTLRFVLQ